MAGKISPWCKWNDKFPFRSVATKKVEQLRRLPTCSGKFPLELHLPFAFQPVEPEILAKWKAPLVYSNLIRSVLEYDSPVGQIYGSIVGF